MNKPKIEDYRHNGIPHYGRAYAKALEKWGDELEAENNHEGLTHKQKNEALQKQVKELKAINFRLYDENKAAVEEIHRLNELLLDDIS